MSSAPSQGGLEDIVVTAQKRSERLQDVPVSVTAIKEEQLASMGVASAVDLRIAAPSLNSTAASGYIANSIRGVGTLAFSPGGESPIGLYIDGVYVAAPQASELSLNNISSVEVLKGPQGTLFGRNATGGLIQITTATPSDVAKGKLEVGYGNFDTWTGKAYLAGGIAEGLAADVSFSGRTRGSIGRNVTNPDFGVGDVHHDISLRSKVVWVPGDTTTITAIGNYWDGRDTLGYFVQVPGKLPGFAQAPIISTDRGYNADFNFPDTQKGWSAGGTLKIEQDLGGAMLTSTTAYRKGALHILRDLDYTFRDVASLDLRQVDRQFSQEFQIGSVGSSRLNWTAGLFYFYLNSSYAPIVIDLDNFPDPVAGFSTVTVNATTVAKSYAGYGQASYEILDDTHLTFGGRYTRERREERGDPVRVDIAFPGVPPIIFPIADRHDTASKFTYRVSLDHRFSPDALAYASFNTGFKSGGFNIGAPGQAPYAPENLKAYEVGLKTDLLDRHLRINVAGFYYDYKNIQVQKLLTSGILFFNGAKARIYGLDADFTAALTDDLTVTGGINWIDTKFTDFPVCDVSSPAGGTPLNPNGVCTGNTIPFAAKLTGSVAVSYTKEVAGGKLNATTNLYYNSGFAFEVDNVLRQPRYAKVNASLKWTSPKGYSIGVFGNNLTDRRTSLLQLTQQSGNTGTTYADPRTYGVTLGFDF
ncbi:MAG: TonB-dependent receptor [Sphingobium sp.]|uniref:TonB-dependent receptor n=1 Tax=Sphingobium sp. TaxID=1912891 RepID=UPI0029B53708|nr:TonB-dependent receptor [Sphingobium sp.]MDX3910212.1 TonB-dependent receptor [Sphingobium sp.]